MRCCGAMRCHHGLPTLSFTGPCCSWNAGKKFMGNVDAFLKSLLNFDKDNVPGGGAVLVIRTWLNA